MDAPEQPDLPVAPPAPALPVAPAAPAAVTEALQQQCQDFKLLFNATFMGLIALALAVNLFLYKQMRLQQWQNEKVRPNFARDDHEYRQKVEPDIHRLMKHLQYYAATHPDYHTNVLSRYRVSLGEFFSTGAVVGQPPPIPQGPLPGALRPPEQ